MISTMVNKIIYGWKEIKFRCNKIYDIRGQYFQERTKEEKRQQKLDHTMLKLEEDAFIFDVPGKFPEAMQATVEELGRRKSFNVAFVKMCNNLQKVAKQERNEQKNFNTKYGDYLSSTLQSDLMKSPISIMFNHQENFVNNQLEFSEEIVPQKEDVLTKFQEILGKVFKDIPIQFP